MKHHLFLLRELVRRDFQSRYAGSLFGFLWSFVQPLFQLVLFTFVFSSVLKMSLLGERTDNFASFFFCGLLPWMAINEGTVRGATAITDNAAIVKKLRFPSQILVFTVVLAALIHAAIAGIVFVVFLAIDGSLSVVTLPVLLFAVPVQVVLTVGIALALAALNVFFRDTTQFLGMVLQGWFFLTPIVYPLSLVPDEFRRWIMLNPLTTLVDLYRLALLGGTLDDVEGVIPLCVTATVVLVVGWLIFARLRPAFVDEL
ncbi:MAG: ABC transporter permease [Acidobacteriota bacterium]